MKLHNSLHKQLLRKVSQTKHSKIRCSWVNLENPLYVAYHDREWCEPVHDDKILFEFLVLESAQAGLSWETILNRREGYRTAFCNFDPKRVAKLTHGKIKKLLLNPSIIRHRGKIESTVTNAQLFLQIQKEYGSFDAYIWNWVSYKPLTRKQHAQGLKIAESISKDLKKRGIKFFGPTICFAYMQAVGMINDHSPQCFKAC